VCLIALAFRVHPEFPLVVAANRDEFYARPTQQAAFWADEPAILAGRDLECLGTWLGVTHSGRFAAVTNYRDPADLRTGAKSRGTLVSRFLASDHSAEQFLAGVASNAQAYRGFNLLVSDGNSLFCYSNRVGEPQRLEPGVYGLSNHLLDTPWPKVTAVRERLREALAPAPSAESLFTLLADTGFAPESELPDTGVGLAREKTLSAARIVSDTYGTRCSTVVMQGADRTMRFAERTFGPEGAELETARFEFRLAG